MGFVLGLASAAKLEPIRTASTRCRNIWGLPKALKDARRCFALIIGERVFGQAECKKGTPFRVSPSSVRHSGSAGDRDRDRAVIRDVTVIVRHRLAADRVVARTDDRLGRHAAQEALA